MSLLHRNRTADLSERTPEAGTPAPTVVTTQTDTAQTDTAQPDIAQPDIAQTGVAKPGGTQQVPRTRVGAAWVGVGAAVVILVALIVFMAQNTRSVDVSFLGMTASTSLALALLIAAVGGVLLTLVVGTARITQLRRVVRRGHR